MELMDDPIDPKKYIIALFKKLLLQRDKMDQGLLKDQLEPAMAKMAQEVLSCLEDRRRKVLDVQSGSMTFTLFCPTQQAALQLQDVTWIHTLNRKITQLIKILGWLLCGLRCLLFIISNLYPIAFPSHPIPLTGIDVHTEARLSEAPTSCRKPDSYMLPWLQQFKRRRDESESREVESITSEKDYQMVQILHCSYNCNQRLSYQMLNSNFNHGKY